MPQKSQDTCMQKEGYLQALSDFEAKGLVSHLHAIGIGSITRTLVPYL